jgi:Tfp pilus assembly protein PilP
MNLRLIILLALVVGLGRGFAADPVAAPAAAVSVRSAASVAAAPVAARPRTESSITPSAGLDTFRLITDRNIFNPNRTGRRERSEEPPPRLDTITLVGTMDSDKGLQAFVDGSDATYRKALHVGESVDKFKVTQITASSVDLERDGKTMSVHVGQQLRRLQGADWNLVGEDVVRRESAARAVESSRPDPTAPPAIPADASDALRRLMEARAKQLKQ